MKFFALILAFLLAAAPARASDADDIARIVSDLAQKSITPDTLTAGFAPLVQFVRRDTKDMLLFTDGKLVDGHVRHAQAQFDGKVGSRTTGDRTPVFSIALELGDEPDFTFDGLAAGFSRRLGTPGATSNRAGATYRVWYLKQPKGRTLTVARGQASDNGEPVTIIQLLQER